MAPINRAPWTALVDDAGTGTTGTPWNKQAIKDVILDPVDAAIVPVPWTMISADLSGTDFPDWNPAPGIVGNTIIYIIAASASATIYGLKPAAPATIGQRVVINVILPAATVINFYHAHPGASPNCLLNCRKAPTVAINGFWAYAEFQYGSYSGGAGWALLGYGNGIGGSLLMDRDLETPMPAEE